jgi:hypothetical protein
MTPRRSITRPAMAACVLAVLLAGCGSSTTVVTDQTPAASPTATTTTSAPSSSSATSSTGSASTSATAVGGVPRCTAAVLSVSFLGQQGATGHGELGFALRNTGSRTCHTFGYPGVLFLSSSGAPLPTGSQRVTQDYFGTAPVTGLNLAPGEHASFRLGVTHVGTSGASCVTAAAVQIIPPDDTHTLHVTVPAGAYECGTVTVSPLRPGNSAFV